MKSQLAGKGFPSLSLSLNVPGFPKSNPIVSQFFGYCLKELKYYLKARLIEIRVKEAIEICDDAGEFFLVPVLLGHFNCAELKQLCEDFEESHPLGRFVDVDLNDEQGNTISSGKSKPCFYCLVQPAITCRRNRSHDLQELRSFMFSKMQAYCQGVRVSLLGKKLSSLALKAILYEISLTPKPGLVDKFSTGSHKDMSFQTFIDSSAAISSWFEELVRTGYSFHESDLTRALPAIRNIGLRMEEAMFESTGKINTQKGIIFLMGLSLFACGKIFGHSNHFDQEQFQSIVREICKDLVVKELGDYNRTDLSHGEEVFQKHGYSGARGEAESGFQIVFESGLPLLNIIDSPGDEAMTRCLLSIAAKNNDTNILSRGGPAVLLAFQALCQAATVDFNEISYKAVAEFCRKENISPGGSADLLAISIFIRSVLHADQNGFFPPQIP